MVSVPLAGLLALLFFTNLGHRINRSFLMIAALLLSRVQKSTSDVPLAESMPKTWTELRGQVRETQQAKRARYQEKLSQRLEDAERAVPRNEGAGMDFITLTPPHPEGQTSTEPYSTPATYDDTVYSDLREYVS